MHTTNDDWTSSHDYHEHGMAGAVTQGSSQTGLPGPGPEPGNGMQEEDMACTPAACWPGHRRLHHILGAGLAAELCLAPRSKADAQDSSSCTFVAAAVATTQARAAVRHMHSHLPRPHVTDGVAGTRSGIIQGPSHSVNHSQQPLAPDAVFWFLRPSARR